MKKIFHIIKGFIIGSVTGIALVLAACLLFTDITPARFFDILAGEGLASVAVGCLLSFVAPAIAFVLHIIVHEGGHLVGGLLTGYRFVSFRIFSLTLLRRDGRYIVRRFNIPGTGGQCIMLPPEGDAAKVPFVIYNAAGGKHIAHLRSRTILLHTLRRQRHVRFSSCAFHRYRRSVDYHYQRYSDENKRHVQRCGQHTAHAPRYASATSLRPSTACSRLVSERHASERLST